VRLDPGPGLRAPTAVLAATLAVALLGPWLPLPSPTATELSARLLPTGSPGHWLGTDALGRDVLSRLVSGLGVTLAVAAFGTAVAAALGTAIGLVAGFRGGRLDDLLMRGMDVVLAFPYVLLALVLVASLGPGLRNAALAVAIVNVPFFARTVRGTTLSLRRQDFVEVARLSGHGDLRILARELLPNVAPVLATATATTLGWMILETAGLSFLGLGAQPPRSDLGSMLGEGRRFLAVAPHLAVAPGLVLFVVSVAVHGFADGLRDRMDPLRAARGEGPRRAGAAPAPPVDPDEDPGEPVLEVEGLSVEIPGAGRVLDGVGLRLAPGGALGVVGESGSGKTVTALALLGVAAAPGESVVSGRIRFRGEATPPLGDPAWRRLRGAGIAWVPQDPGTSLNPVRTVGAQVLEALRAHRPLSRREARDAGLALLDRLRLNAPERVWDAHPHELSGGMKQRILIAMALAQRPQVLVADEPTTALDVTVQAGILELLAEVRREFGCALLVVTHDLGVVAALCRRVVVMRDGRVVESGAMERVLRAPRADYTRSLLACVPTLDDPARLLRAGREAQ